MTDMRPDKGSVPPMSNGCHKREDPRRATRLLLEELTHRVDQEFAAALRTVTRAMERVHHDEMKDALAAVRLRLEGFARVHQTLKPPDSRASVDGYAYLQKLCEAIRLSRMELLDIRLELREKELELDSEQCWRLGLIVSELVRNASRHAFVNRFARVRVSAARRGALIWCQVEDNGVPAENEWQARGLRIVEALTRELHGALEQLHQHDSCVATVIFPAFCESDRECASLSPYA